MSWPQQLVQVYDACSKEIGKMPEKGAPLLPVFHTTQLAQIEMTIDLDGNLVEGGARVLTDKAMRTTIIPCTEASGSRTSGACPQPLFDKLEYMAGDYALYCPPKKEDRFALYLKQLQDWCQSPQAHPSVRAILEYLKKRTLIRDLVAQGVLFTDGDGQLLQKWNREEAAPPIFFLCGQIDAFVRIRVFSSAAREQSQSQVWIDRSVWDCWIQYQQAQARDRDICYATGERTAIAGLSPKKIRNAGDGAKLISANDSTGFTYRGRFDKPGEAALIGRETTEKAHNALRWLVGRQGAVNGEQVIVSWGLFGRQTVDLTMDSMDWYMSMTGADKPSLDDDFAKRFKNAVRGYGEKLTGSEMAVIMGLDSATPGRLSVFFYREAPEKDLVARVAHWHTTCRFWLNYRLEQTEETDAKGKALFRRISFAGAPAPRDILEAAYGQKMDDKLRKSATARLLPCIADGAPLPVDIMHCTVDRASRPITMERWEAEKTCSIACALIRKVFNDQYKINHPDDEKEKWPMALDKEISDRSYLFGRALAYAQKIESYALKEMNEDRRTNAERLMTAFAQHPARTWKQLYGQLLPYIIKLESKGDALVQQMNEVVSLISFQDFNNEALSEPYLLGYACQMQVFHEQMLENIRLNQKKEAQKMQNDAEQGGK